MPAIWFGDFRVLTTFLTILSLCVVFSIQWVEHSRIRYPSGVALFYWLLLLISFAVKLRSLISQQLYRSELPYFIVYCVGVGLSLVEFLVEWLWPRNVGPNGYEAIEEEEECPVEYCNAFSQLTFSWMTPMMKYGYKVFLTEDDLWALAKDDQTKNTGARFDKAWQYELEHRKNPSLWIVLFKAYGGPYMLAAVYKIGNDISQYIQPQLLRLLIAFVYSYHDPKQTKQPVIQGAAIALAMFACAVFQTTMVVSDPSTTLTISVTDMMAAPILPARFCDGYAHQGWIVFGHLPKVASTVERRQSRQVNWRHCQLHGR